MTSFLLFQNHFWKQKNRVQKTFFVQFSSSFWSKMTDISLSLRNVCLELNKWYNFMNRWNWAQLCQVDITIRLKWNKHMTLFMAKNNEYVRCSLLNMIRRSLRFKRFWLYQYTYQHIKHALDIYPYPFIC